MQRTETDGYIDWSIMKKIAISIVGLLVMVIFPCFPSFGINDTIPGDVKKYTVKIVGELSHHINSFTQGLIFHEDKIYESTGLVGLSSLRQIDAHTGIVEKIFPVPGVFAEGLARWNNHLIQLTWNDHIAFIYNISDFSKVGILSYETQGWGLTADNRHLIMSDGSDRLYFRNPNSFDVERTIHVRYQGKPLNFINELEYVDGLIYANIWQKKIIVQIDPADGMVVGYIDCEALFQRLPPLDSENVLNGIAFNDKTKTFYLTGKNWPKIFQVVLVPES
ncbi:MAG: glutaminyl-peptide cyclotransferase [Desulfobacterales bacterium]|nr:glutaminyl-peptide cyclotransferase [Desulfobacterales bacterium]